MKILVTGTAGFVGSEVAFKLLNRGDTVIGVDNHNEYYDPLLKEARIERFINHKEYEHFRVGIENKEDLDLIFSQNKFDGVIHLAAQAGVRYSVENPDAYISSNIVGFMNILEACRHNSINHLV